MSNRRKLLTASLLVIAACQGDAGLGIDSQPSRLGDLHFEAPADWHQQGAQDRASSLWVPESNPAKESVEIIRTEIRGDVAEAGIPAIEQLLVTAQRSLPHAKVSPALRFSSNHGLAGVRLTADYVPAGLTSTYHRVHVVLVDGTTLVNVLYTAVSPDADLKALNLVLSTMRHGEA